jgi:transposase
MTTLVDDLVPDELWALVAPLPPAPPRPPYGGRHRTISNRACFAAIVYTACTSTPWRLLPARERGALRAIDSTARPRSWRTCGPRRLRRQSQPVVVATHGGRVGVP